MIEGLARIEDVEARSRKRWAPPPKLTLSEWADAHFVLSPESSAQAGRWSTLPYQRGIMDAITDPRVERVSLMKSARVGYTKIVNATIGYFIDQDPCPILVVQPTVDDAKGYSKEEIAPMLRDSPRLAEIIFSDEEETGPRDGGNTILHKKFPGGVLSMIGANSGAGFRRISRRVVIFDEVDGYPPSAGSDGDPVKLGTKRTEFYHNRKIIAGSTPLLAGSSRITDLFSQGDQRRYFVPCPQCGHMDFLRFRESADHRGHWLAWPEGKPHEAHFVCSQNGCAIEHHHKRDMIAAGEWRAERPFTGHASFHVWAAYSYSPNATWGHLAAEFLEAKGDREKLRTFVNTVLGETWQEAGEVPEWERIYERREPYPIGSLPQGIRFLTCGVDVQKDRWVYEVVGWAPGRESWTVDAGVIPGDPGTAAAWTALDQLRERTFEGPAGQLRIARMAIDSGYATQNVYNYARQHPADVIAVKGAAGMGRVIIGAPSDVDVTHNGIRIARGAKVWPVGVDTAKSELYGFLRARRTDSKFPPGWCHFPELEQEFFRQLTSEQLVAVRIERTGHTRLEWQVIPGRENHWLDARVYARAAAASLGLDRMEPAKAAPPAGEPVPVVIAAPAAPPPPRVQKPRADSRFFGQRGKGWLGR